MEKAYETYKDSGIEWIGKIPESWTNVPLKHIANTFGRIGYRGYTVADIVDEGNGAISLSPSNINNQRLVFNKKTFISWEKYDESPEIQIFEGDVVLVKTASVGKATIIDDLKDFKATINPQLVVFKEIKFDKKYFYYCLISDLIQKRIESETNGGVVGTLTQQSINTYDFPKPSLQEQTQIAAYLDYHTQLIDNLISKKETLIQELQEQRKAIINEAVTKGVNKNVALKDSGIEWLGEIPEHWEVVKLRYLVDHSTVKGDGTSTFKIALENIESNTGRLLFEDSKEFQGELKLFEKGDVLFNKLRPYLAKVLLAPEDGECVSELLVFRALDNVLSNEFLFYRMISEQIISIVDSSTYGAKMPRASVDFILNISLALPSLKEQVEIVSGITKKLTIAENLKNQTITSIQKLKEYRQSLISEAVTGKIDVRDWQRPNN
tara:strand:+ start:454 stop:1764 length:1311 start_codon:yes stop_codon:yes gene_type:complete